MWSCLTRKKTNSLIRIPKIVGKIRSHRQGNYIERNKRKNLTYSLVVDR